MEGLHEKGVFTKVRRVPGMCTIPTRFVFKIKTDQYGNVTKYKARLVTKGFVQQKGTDFTESYAPTSSAVAIRAAIAIATAYYLEIEHLDVTQAFLNAEIDQLLHVEPPDGDEDGPSSRDFVYKLNYALYCLIQAPMLAIGYEGSTFTLQKDGMRLILVTYVDDLQLIYDKKDSKLSDWFKEEFGKQFKITNEGDLSWHLGVHYIRDRENKTTFCTQARYVDTLLEKYGYTDLKPRDTPAVAGEQLTKAPPDELLNDAEAKLFREQL
eukprot:3426421-Rhodomonas_salina.1